MSAPSIPNLATLRNRGGGRRGRGQGRELYDTASLEDQEKAKDSIVQQTDNDAATSRMSAIALGYMTDPFAKAFVPGPPPRRYTLINRGTYVRSMAIDRLVCSFLDACSNGKKQIISLGAGSDTRFFRFSEFRDLVYHEIDFPVNTSTKIAKIMESSTMRSKLPESEDLHVSDARDTIRSRTLNIHALDLRDLCNGDSAIAALPNLDPAAPTLILSECCLTYLPRDSGDKILTSLLQKLLHSQTPAAVVLYEPVKPNDPFGQTMTSNLASRSIEMPALHHIPTIQAHRARLHQLGLDRQGARTVYDIYMGSRELSSGDDSGAMSEEWISPGERSRIERLEWLDEVEEWKLLAGHYCMVWGWRDGTEPNGRVFSHAWGSIAGHWTSKERQDDALHGVTSPSDESSIGSLHISS